VPIDDRMLAKLEDLVGRYEQLGERKNDEHKLMIVEDRSACRAWIAAALNAVQSICPASNAYRLAVENAAGINVVQGFSVYKAVVDIATIVKELIKDAKAGLLTNLADAVRAETFVEFLDHGKAYLRDQSKMESGVIIGVVFEDSIRRICEKKSIPQAGRQLDDLISQLQKTGDLSAVQAKRARVGAAVRTNATHAQWNEFQITDVEDALKITEEIIEQHLSYAPQCPGLKSERRKPGPRD